MSTTLTVARHLVNECQRYGPVTPLKLQKLLYYVKAWGTVIEVDLVPGNFKKWDYGPVSPPVYHEFKKYGRNPIPEQSRSMIWDQEKRELIDFIGTCYAQFDAVTLSRMTHKEDPWKETSNNEVIPDKLMEDYYSEHPFARNFPFDPESGPFYPVEADSNYGFTLDMEDSEAESVTTYNSFSEYLEHLQKANSEYKEWRESFLA